MIQNGRVVMLMVGLLCAAGLTQASDTERAGFDVLNWETGGRSSALSASVMGIGGDLQHLAYNPAALFGVASGSVSLSYQKRFADIQSGQLAYCQHFMGFHTAATLSYANYGEMTRMDVAGQALGTFTPNHLVATLTGARSLATGLVLGVSAKYVAASMDEYSASAVAMDAGVHYTIASQDLTLGLAVCNAGVALDAFVEEKEKLPAVLRMGGSKQLAHLPLLFNVSVVRFLYQDSGSMGGIYWNLGGEFTLSDALKLRFGYNSRGREEKVADGQSRMAGFSFGLGMRISKIQIDAGYGLYGALGTVPTVSIGFLK